LTVAAANSIGLPLPQFAGEQLIGFVLVLARVGGLFVFAPVFSSRLIPLRVRGILACALALPLTPLAMRGQVIPTQAADIAPVLVKEALVGLAFALSLGLVVAAVQAAASFLDVLTGFSYASIVDPMTNMQGGALAQVYSVVAVMVFLFTGGERLVMLGLARSYDLLPLGSLPSTASLASLATDELSQISLVGLELAAPVLIALLVTETAFAVVARAVPQMNIFFVGLPLKIIVGLGVVAASLPLAAHHLEGDITSSVMRGLQALAGR
jgi:flagellar biosynthetic protein FliR